MKQRRGWFVVLLVVLAGALLLSCGACGLGVWWWSRQSNANTTPVAASTVRPGVTGGGELRLAGDEPVTLDPAMVQDSYSSVYLVEIYSGLVTLDQNLEVAPDLAESWDLSADGRTYTFHLRPNAAFQDGKPVTAADVKYSFDRACSSALRSPAAASYLDDIEGALDAISGKAKQVSGVQVVDDHTVTVRIDAPKAYFLAKLTYPTAFVLDKASVASGANWTTHPNGTGPFRLAERTEDKIVLERNEHYYGDAPLLQRVSYVLQGGSPMTMYENDQLDIVQVGLADLERVQDPTNVLSRELSVVPQLDVQYLAMNANVPPFDDVKVRQAFAYAIDRQRLANVTFSKSVTAAGGILPPDLPGYNPQQMGLFYDPDRARLLLSESKYKDAAGLREVVLNISGTGGTMPQMIDAIAQMLKDNLGVDVQVVQTPWQQFLADLNDHAYGLYYSGWMADYPDPEDFIDILFNSQSPNNHMGYLNPEVDRLSGLADVEQKRDTRMQYYQQAETLILQDAIWIPLYHGRDYVLTKPYVKGAVHSAAIRPWLKDVSIQK